jgi:hypothetical protein
MATQRKKQSSGWGALALVCVLFVFFASWALGKASVFVAQTASEIHLPSPEAPPLPPPSPPTKQDALAFAVELKACVLYENMPEPDSVEWLNVVANENVSTVCFRYRARNSFGGKSIEETVFSHGHITKGPSSWNAHCTGKAMLNLMPEAAYNLRPGLCRLFSQ